MKIPDHYYLIPKEAITAINDIVNAAEEAIQEIWARAIRDQRLNEMSAEARAFYEMHARLVHGDDVDLDQIF